MRGVEPGRDLPRGVERFGGIERAAAKLLGKRLALEILHREVKDSAARPVVAEELVYAADVGVGHLARQLQLFAEARFGGAVAQQAGPQDFEGDNFAAERVLGPVDFAHASAPDHLEDSKPAAQNFSATQLGIAGRLGRNGGIGEKIA